MGLNRMVLVAVVCFTLFYPVWYFPTMRGGYKKLKDTASDHRQQQKQEFEQEEESRPPTAADEAKEKEKESENVI